MLCHRPSTKRVLNAEQVDVLTRWVDADATYVEHWAFQPLSKSTGQLEPDQVGRSSGSNPIDVYVSQATRQRGLSLAPPAERSTWLRRAALDVTGLPPTYDDVLQYEHDSRPDAKERMVDRTTGIAGLR